MLVLSCYCYSVDFHLFFFFKPLGFGLLPLFFFYSNSFCFYCGCFVFCLFYYLLYHSSITLLIARYCKSTGLFVGTTTRRTLWCHPRRFLRTIVGIIPSSSFVVVFVPIGWQFCRVACVVLWWTACTCI